MGRHLRVRGPRRHSYRSPSHHLYPQGKEQIRELSMICSPTVNIGTISRRAAILTVCVGHFSYS